MLRLDHFVMHIDHDQEKMKFLKEKFDEYGIPFEPGRRKATEGFKVEIFGLAINT
ncbi:MAG: hypothetical protein ACXVNF_04640 [Neobacillus sp.]